MVCGNIFISCSLAIRSHDQFKASHWSTAPPTFKKRRKSDGPTWWRVCYQRGLPRLVNRPGVAGAVLQTPCNSFIESAFSSKSLKYHKSQRPSKSHHWFKSYVDFAEWVDFTYWWSFSGGGSATNGATPSSLDLELVYC